MGENEEEWGMEEGRIVFVKLQLVREIIPRIIIGVDFVHPQGFCIKPIEPQCKTYKQTKEQNNHFLALHTDILQRSFHRCNTFLLTWRFRIPKK
jgi:hypothetical protein